MYTVTVNPFAHSYDCEDGETLLDAALRNSLLLKYGCKHGGCGTCKVRLVDGDVDERGSSFALTPQDRADDVVLACASTPLEPCVIDVAPSGLTEDEFLSGDTSRPYGCVVEQVTGLTADIAGVRLRLTDGEMSFNAGQFVNVQIPGTNLLRTFSLANAPADGAVVELIVKLYPDGAFSRFLREDAAPGAAITVHGPYGQLRVHLSHRPVMMIAGGSGLAPLLSMLKDMANKGFDRPVTLYFGARTERDLYCVDEISAHGQKLMDFEFVPVLSESSPDNWTGETGMVTDAIRRRHRQLAHDVYLCGPPPMIDAAVPLLTAAGVRPRNIYFDAFTPADIGAAATSLH
jgi:NAD(P)H-flavin reductase/ferredoxin